MKKTLSTLIAIAAICNFASAQTLGQYRAKLAAASAASEFAIVEVNEDLSAKEALAKLDNDPSSKKVAGYRVGVFLSNSPNARSQANAVVAICDSLFADVVTTLSYDNPYFKVNAGYCLTLEEGVILLNRLQSRFPRAYLLREDITPNNLVRSWNREKNLRK